MVQYRSISSTKYGFREMTVPVDFDKQSAQQMAAALERMAETIGLDESNRQALGRGIAIHVIRPEQRQDDVGPYESHCPGAGVAYVENGQIHVVLKEHCVEEMSHELFHAMDMRVAREQYAGDFAAEKDDRTWLVSRLAHLGKGDATCEKILDRMGTDEQILSDFKTASRARMQAGGMSSLAANLKSRYLTTNQVYFESRPEVLARAFDFAVTGRVARPQKSGSSAAMFEFDTPERLERASDIATHIARQSCGLLERQCESESDAEECVTHRQRERCA